MTSYFPQKLLLLLLLLLLRHPRPVATPSYADPFVKLFVRSKQQLQTQVKENTRRARPALHERAPGVAWRLGGALGGEWPAHARSRCCMLDPCPCLALGSARPVPATPHAPCCPARPAHAARPLLPRPALAPQPPPLGREVTIHGALPRHPEADLCHVR